MITCKEDLMNTYIRNDNGELLELYIASCLEFGFHLSPAFNDSKLLDDEFMFIATGIDGDSVWAVNNRYDAMTSQLTISDLKVKQPKPSPTKFVKVEESIFDLEDEFERGELYEKGSNYTKLISESDFAFAYRENAIYRQVEIDWRDELDSYLDSISSLDSNFDEKVTLEFSGSKFAYNLSDDEFVAACHLVASLTEKPEGV